MTDGAREILALPKRDEWEPAGGPLQRVVVLCAIPAKSYWRIVYLARELAKGLRDASDNVTFDPLTNSLWFRFGLQALRCPLDLCDAESWSEAARVAAPDYRVPVNIKSMGQAGRREVTANEVCYEIVEAVSELLTAFWHWFVKASERRHVGGAELRDVLLAQLAETDVPDGGDGFLQWVKAALFGDTDASRFKALVSAILDTLSDPDARCPEIWYDCAGVAIRECPYLIQSEFLNEMYDEGFGEFIRGCAERTGELARSRKFSSRHKGLDLGGIRVSADGMQLWMARGLYTIDGMSVECKARSFCVTGLKQWEFLDALLDAAVSARKLVGDPEGWVPVEGGELNGFKSAERDGLKARIDRKYEKGSGRGRPKIVECRFPPSLWKGKALFQEI